MFFISLHQRDSNYSTFHQAVVRAGSGSEEILLQRWSFHQSCQSPVVNIKVKHSEYTGSIMLLAYIKRLRKTNLKVVVANCLHERLQLLLRVEVGDEVVEVGRGSGHWGPLWSLRSWVWSQRVPERWLLEVRSGWISKRLLVKIWPRRPW